MLRRGYVLAGGQSRRFGSDKAKLIYQGTTLLQRALITLQELDLETRVVISSRLRTNAPLDALSDRVSGAGPLGGLQRALEDVGEGLCFLLACDLPLVEARLFRILESRIAGFDLAVPRDSRGRIHPLCGIYSTRCRETLDRLLQSGDFRVQELLLHPQLRARVVEARAEGFPDRTFLNVNRPEDWRCLQSEHPR